jgi:hypothetical protein
MVTHVLACVVSVLSRESEVLGLLLRDPVEAKVVLNAAVERAWQVRVFIIELHFVGVMMCWK